MVSVIETVTGVVLDGATALPTRIGLVPPGGSRNNFTVAPPSTPETLKLGKEVRVIREMPSVLLTPVSFDGARTGAAGAGGAVVSIMMVALSVVIGPGLPARSTC